MDFLDPKKKKLHRIQLFIGYGLMAIVLSIGSVILLYRAYGYNLNPRTGDIVQNGLVFIDAHPEAADISLNGQSKGTTSQRLDMPAGDYLLELKRNGYRDWSRSFTLEGGKIERFVYPFLFPAELKTTDVQLYASTPGLVTKSPDRSLVLVQQTGTFQSFDLIDTTTEVAGITTLTLPPNLLQATGPTHTLEMVEWSSDSRHVLLKHSFQNGQEFFVVDTESVGASANISKAFNVSFTSLTLRDKKFDQFYLFDQVSLNLLAADLRTGAATPILSNVITFRPHGADVLIYITTAGAAEGKALVRVREGTQDFTIREIPTASSYVVEVARFENAWYFAAGSGAEQKTYVFRNPVTAVKNLPDRRPVPVGILRLDAPAEHVSFSTNARFVVVQAGSQFSVYDAETDRQDRYDTKLTLSPGQKASWMDGHRLTLATQDKVVVFDYDGTNLQTMSPAYSGTPVVFNNNYTAMFSLGPSTSVAGRPAFTRTELVVKP